jgi:hypothetical protein
MVQMMDRFVEGAHHVFKEAKNCERLVLVF